MMNLSVFEFAGKIITAVQQKAKDIGIAQGAVSVCFSPCSGKAADWLGTDADISITKPVTGTSTIYRENGIEFGDCFGIVAEKIAAAKKVLMIATNDHFQPLDCTELVSGSLPEVCIGDGRVAWKGCVAYPIGYHVGYPCENSGADAMTIFVSVSGDKEEDDEKAAWAALSIIREVIDKNHDDGWMLARILYEIGNPAE